MRIQKFIVENFQGLAGVHTFNMSQKLTINIGKNGSGKTSFVNALRYVLTGVEPAGEVITRGAKRTTVTIILQEGIAFTREKSLERGNRVYINKKVTTVTAFMETLNRYIPVAPIKTLSSSEKVAQMKPQELEAYLLAHAQDIPKEEIMGMLPAEISEDGRDICNKQLPDMISSENLTKFLSYCTEQRKSMKKSVLDLNATLKVLAQDLHAPEASQEILSQLLKAAEDNYNQAMVFESSTKAYEEAQMRLAKHNEMLAELEKSLQELPEGKFNPEERMVLNESYMKARESRDIAVQNAASCRASIESMQNVLDKLDQPVCPFSDKLKCTTDKTEIRKDIMEAITESEKAEISAKRLITRYENKMNKCLEELKAMDEIKNAAEKRKLLEKQRDQLLMSAPKLPEKPKFVDVATARDKVVKARKEYTNYEKFDRYMSVKKQYLAERQIYLTFEALVAVFGDKGIVKEKITERFIHKFVDMCNEKAQTLRVDMKMKYQLDNGVVLLTDFGGKDLYLTADSLSGGEKAQFIFVLMSVLCELSGFGILMLDELSVLDADGFSYILNMAKNNMDDFDHIVLCAVDHADVVELVGRKEDAA